MKKTLILVALLVAPVFAALKPGKVYGEGTVRFRIDKLEATSQNDELLISNRMLLSVAEDDPDVTELKITVTEDVVLYGTREMIYRVSLTNNLGQRVEPGCTLIIRGLDWDITRIKIKSIKGRTSVDQKSPGYYWNNE